MIISTRAYDFRCCYFRSPTRAVDGTRTERERAVGYATAKSPSTPILARPTYTSRRSSTVPLDVDTPPPRSAAVTIVCQSVRARSSPSSVYRCDNIVLLFGPSVCVRVINKYHTSLSVSEFCVIVITGDDHTRRRVRIVCWMKEKLLIHFTTWICLENFDSRRPIIYTKTYWDIGYPQS